MLRKRERNFEEKNSNYPELVGNIQQLVVLRFIYHLKQELQFTKQTLQNAIKFASKLLVCCYVIQNQNPQLL